MQALFSRRAVLQLLTVACGFLFIACAALDHGVDAGPNAAGRWQNKTVYLRVGMRVEPNRLKPGWHMYSSNHIGLPKHFAVGTKFTVRTVGHYTVDLVDEGGAAVQLEYVAMHHPDLNFDSWLDRQLSTSPVDPSWWLKSSERAAIEAGRYEVGMSRNALFLAIGYPPATLSPNLKDSPLTYEVKRFNRIVFTFDDKDRVSNIRN